jgi:hypothetical protein
MPAMTGTRSSTATAAVTALALLLASTTPAFGADQELLVRAVGQPPGRELVSLLARSAEPRTILLAEHPDYAGLTYSALAEKFCGAVPDGYLDELRAINPGQTIDLVALAGSAAFSVKWPACFEVRNNVTYKIRKNDNPTVADRGICGRPGTRYLFSVERDQPADRNPQTGNDASASIPDAEDQDPNSVRSGGGVHGQFENGRWPPRAGRNS